MTMKESTSEMKSDNKRKKKKRKNVSIEKPASFEKKRKTEVQSVVEHSVQNENVDSGDSDHENMKKVEVTKEECNKFSGKFLRNSFNSADGIYALQKFVAICNDEKKDLAAEYIQAGGSVLEILRLLDSSEKKNFNNVCTVFTAMHILIMKILSKYPQNQSSAGEACRHLINTHLSSIHSMLSSQGKARHRKIVLKLLASVVSLGGTLPRELLNHLSLHSELVETLVSHSKPMDSQNVRTCFIHFILAFLIEGDASDIKALLDKRGVVASILSGLVYDSPVMVQLVLNTVKKYILENSTITKTTKLHVFTTQVIQGLVNLYNWKGPKHWTGHKNSKPTTEPVNSEEKELAVSAVHEFLVTLLTSNRYGIAFHNRSFGIDSGGKHNQLINTVLQSLDKPWEHEKPSELVVKILTACPDLIKPQLIYTEPFLVPRISRKWVTVIHFIKKVIDNINIENCLKLCSTEVTTAQLSNAILNLIIPPIVMKNAVIPSLEHESPIIHYEIIQLVLTMVKKVEILMAVVENINRDKTENLTFRSNVLEYNLKHLPSFEFILKIWSKAFELKPSILDTDEDLEVELKDRLFSILNLLEAYSDNFPEILSSVRSTDTKEEPCLLLTGLDNVKDISEDDLTVMKVKALKIILCSNFSSKEEIFNSALPFLMTKVGDNNVVLDFEVRQTISLFLNRCEVFEGFKDEIEIWIDSLSHIDNFDDKLEVANWILKIMKRVSKHVEKYILLIRKNEEANGEDIVDVNKQEDIFNELYEKNIDDVKSIASMLPVTSISLFLYAAIENLEKHCSNLITLSNYISHVLAHILHCQVLPRAFIVLVGNIEIPVKKYITCWSNEDFPVPIEKPFDSKSVFRNVSNILLNNDGQCKISIKETQLCLSQNGGTVNHSISSFEIKALLRMINFHFIQLLRKTETNMQDITVYKTLILSLFKIANDSDESENLIKDCVKIIFKHPVLLQYFNGIYIHENSKENIVTILFMDIFALFSELAKQSLIAQLLYPFQQQFILQIKSTITKNKNKVSKKEINGHSELINYLQLDCTTIVDLLSTVMNLPKDKFLTIDSSQLSVWGIMVPKLIDRLSTEIVRDETESFVTIHEDLLRKIFVYLIELKLLCKQDLDLWENSLHQYLLKFSHNISVINGKTFVKLLESNKTPATVKILCLLVERNPKLITPFIKVVDENNDLFEQKLLIFSILSSNLKYQWNEEFLNKLSKSSRVDIISYLTDMKTDQWIMDNVEAIAYVIEKTFDSKSCREICDIILSNGDKLDAAQEEHIQLFHILFKKSIDVKPDSLGDFVQILIHVMVTALKKDSKNIQKLRFLSKMLVDCTTALKRKDDFTFEELHKNYSWPQFIRISLKFGLKIVKDELKDPSFLLQTLVSACNVAYRDNSNEEYIKTIFEMTTSHSEFVNIMLSKTNVKAGLTEFLWTIVSKNSTVMVASHIPLYLASYNATLSKSDQFICKILKHYENNNVKLESCRPYLWGSAAASHYSVKGDTDTALWRQPSTSQVLDLLNPEIVTNTIKHFPVHRSWEEENECAINSEVYDPAFYLPVLTHLLVDYNVVACHKVIHSGALALSIVACSSTCKQVRLAAFTVISRFYFHLEATSSKEKLLWINFIDALRNGIFKIEAPLENIRLNGFVATFLARTSLDMTQPLSPLYSALQSFLMAKPALDLNTIPEFLQLYHSSDIEHRAHRDWILETICYGLKIDSDMDVASKCFLFKMLFDFFSCILSSRTSKNLILKIVRSATTLPKSCMILVDGYSLLPWLIMVAEMNLKKGDTDSNNYILDIMNNILNALSITKSRETNYYLMLVKVLLRLKLCFNHNSPIECFKKYVDIFTKVIINSVVCKAVTKTDVTEIVNISAKMFKDLSECKIMLHFGCKFVNHKESDRSISLKESLCRFISTWYTFKNEK